MAAPKAAGQAIPNLLGSGVEAPPLGIGMAALGRPGYITLTHDSDFTGEKTVEVMKARSHAVLDAAWAAGVRYFDAARSYGKGEEFLASWIKERGIQPGEIAVGSKWGYTYTANWRVDTGGEPHEVKEHTAENLAKQSAESAELLGGHLDLYQIHSATQSSGVLDNAAVLEGLWGIKRGRGWRIGLSVSGVEQGDMVRKALSVKDSTTGELLFDSVQATFNLLESSAGPALLEASKAGLQVIVKEGMANGRLFKEGNTGPSASKLSALHSEAARLSCGVDALGLACVMVQGFKPVVLSGAASEQHMLSNAAALALLGGGGLSAGKVAELFEATRMDPEAYWAERSALAWK